MPTIQARAVKPPSVGNHIRTLRHTEQSRINWPAGLHNATIGADLNMLRSARYFLTWEVPPCQHEMTLLENRDDTCMGMPTGEF